MTPTESMVRVLAESGADDSDDEKLPPQFVDVVFRELTRWELFAYDRLQTGIDIGQRQGFWRGVGASTGVIALIFSATAALVTSGK